MRCFPRFGNIFYNLKNVENNHGGMLLLVTLQVSAKSRKASHISSDINRDTFSRNEVGDMFFMHFFPFERSFSHSFYKKVQHIFWDKCCEKDGNLDFFFMFGLGMKELNWSNASPTCSQWQSLHEQIARFGTVCTILKNVKNTHGEVLLLVKLQASACSFTKSNISPWVFSHFLNCTNDTKSRKASQIMN